MVASSIPDTTTIKWLPPLSLLLLPLLPGNVILSPASRFALSKRGAILPTSSGRRWANRDNDRRMASNACKLAKLSAGANPGQGVCTQ